MATRITIGRDDRLAAIIAGVLDAPERVVEVLVPFGQETLFHEEDLLQLRQETQAGGKTVTILTDDQHLRGVARRMGFYVGGAHDADRRFRPVADIVAAPASEHPLQKTGALPALEPEVSPPAESAGSEPAPVFSDESVQDQGESILDVGHKIPRLSFPPFLRSKLAVTLGLIAVGLAVGGGALGVLLPSVTVTVIPRSEELRLNLPFTASTNPKNSELAGQQVSEETSLTQEFPTTGKADVTTFATGTVRIYNAYNGESQTLVEKTRLVSQDGKLFRTSATVVVPGANVSGGNIQPSSVEVGVVAAEAGPDYNAGPSTFSIPGFQGTPKYTGFYGKSDQPMQGGAKGVTAIATEDDVSKATQGLEAKAIDEIEAKFKAKVPEGLVLLDDAKLRTVTITTNVKAGTSGDKVVAHAQAKIQGVLFSGSDVSTQVEAAIKKQLGQDVVILPGSLAISYSVSERSFEKGTLKIAADVSAKAARAIDVDALKREIAGKKEAQIRARLSADENIDFSRVTFSPFFVSHAPKNLERVRVVIQYDANKP